MAKQVKKDNLSALKQALDAGEPGKLYLFWGEEDYLREHYVGLLKAALVDSGMEAFNYRRLEGPSLTPAALQEAVDAMPVFAQRTFCEVRDLDLAKCSEAMKKQVETILADLPDYCCLLFVYTNPAFQPDMRAKLYTRIKKEGLAVEFTGQDQAALVKWVQRRFGAMGHSISRENAVYLLFLCGDLMRGLIQEIEKIGAYSKAKEVTRADIDAVATPVVDAVVFQLTDAVSKRQFSKAMEIMGALLQMREAPIMILAMLGRQMRQLYGAKLCQEEGLSVKDVQALWNMRSDYPARLLLEGARRFSKAWCRSGVLLCAQADLDMKTGGGEPEEILKTVLLKLIAEEAA